MGTAGSVADKRWRAESFRASVASVSFTPTPIFRDLVGRLPDETTTRPSQNMMQEIGSVNDSRLTVAQTAHQLDMIMSDKPEANLSDPNRPDYRPFFWVGDVKPAVQEFMQLIERLVKLKPATSQVTIAFAGIVEAGSEADAVDVVNSTRPGLGLDPNADHDISFQVRSDIPTVLDRAMYVIRKYQTLAGFSPHQLLVVPFGSQILGQQRYAARIEVETAFLSTSGVALSAESITQFLGQIRPTISSTIFGRGDVL